MSKSSSTILIIGNLITLISTFVVNFYAGVIGLNGKTTGQISDLYPVLITPANYVFTIWTIIYLLLLVFAIYQALPSKRGAPFLSKIGYFFMLSGIANMAWLFLWHWGYVVASVIPMFLLLLCLILIYLRLDIGRAKVPIDVRLAVFVPFSVYLGWITVAPITNVAAALYSLGLDGLGLGEVTWTVLVIAIAVIITGIVILTRGDIAYSLVIIWALSGVAVKQSAIQSIYYACIAGIAVIAIVLVAVTLLRMRKSPKTGGATAKVPEATAP